MPGIEEFVAAPCEVFLEHCTKDQLLEIAEYDLDLSGPGDNCCKEKGVLVPEKCEPDQSAAQQFSDPSGSRTFAQQKELLLLQQAHQRLELEKYK